MRLCRWNGRVGEAKQDEKRNKIIRKRKEGCGLIHDPDVPDPRRQFIMTGRETTILRCSSFGID